MSGASDIASTIVDMMSAWMAFIDCSGRKGISSDRYDLYSEMYRKSFSALESDIRDAIDESYVARPKDDAGDLWRIGDECVTVRDGLHWKIDEMRIYDADVRLILVRGSLHMSACAGDIRRPSHPVADVIAEMDHYVCHEGGEEGASLQLVQRWADELRKAEES